MIDSSTFLSVSLLFIPLLRFTMDIFHARYFPQLLRYNAKNVVKMFCSICSDLQSLCSFFVCVITILRYYDGHFNVPLLELGQAGKFLPVITLLRQHYTRSIPFHVCSSSQSLVMLFIMLLR